MSILRVLPDFVAAASGNLENIGSEVRAANAVAATQTTAIAAPALDEVSAAVTALFGTHAQQFQSVSARAAAFHDDFVNLLNGGAAQYVNTEAANAQQALVSAVNAPAQGLLGAAEATAASQVTNLGPISIFGSVGPEGVFQTMTLNGPFGPVASVSLNAASIVASDVTGYSGLIANVNGAVNTPFGPVEWFSFSGSHLATATGQFSTSFSQSGPLGPEGFAVNGSLPYGITGVSISTMGLQFWLQGTEFGVTPLFLRR